MKKLLIALLFISSCLYSCDKDENENNNDNTDCLIGTWCFFESNFNKTFTFNSDNTGVEVQAADDIRNFTWSIKNDQPVVVYIGESTEWVFNLNCEKNELTILWATYKKQ